MNDLSAVKAKVEASNASGDFRRSPIAENDQNEKALVSLVGRANAAFHIFDIIRSVNDSTFSAVSEKSELSKHVVTKLDELAQQGRGNSEENKVAREQLKELTRIVEKDKNISDEERELLEEQIKTLKRGFASSDNRLDSLANKIGNMSDSLIAGMAGALGTSPVGMAIINVAKNSVASLYNSARDRMKMRKEMKAERAKLIANTIKKGEDQTSVASLYKESSIDKQLAIETSRETKHQNKIEKKTTKQKRFGFGRMLLALGGILVAVFSSLVSAITSVIGSITSFGVSLVASIGIFKGLKRALTSFWNFIKIFGKRGIASAAGAVAGSSATRRMTTVPIQNQEKPTEGKKSKKVGLMKSIKEKASSLFKGKTAARVGAWFSKSILSKIALAAGATLLAPELAGAIAIGGAMLTGYDVIKSFASDDNNNVPTKEQQISGKSAIEEARKIADEKRKAVAVNQSAKAVQVRKENVTNKFSELSAQTNNNVSSFVDNNTNSPTVTLSAENVYVTTKKVNSEMSEFKSNYVEEANREIRKAEKKNSSTIAVNNAPTMINNHTTNEQIVGTPTTFNDDGSFIHADKRNSL